MSVSIAQFLSEKKLPKFIAESKALLACKSVSKVFPSIGLSNCSQEIKLENRDFAYDSGVILHRAILDQLVRYYIPLNPGTYIKRRLPTDKVSKVQELGYLQASLYDVLANRSSKDYVIIENGKIYLRLILNAIYKGEVIFKKGQSIFKAYNKLVNDFDALKCGYKLKPLDEMSEFKAFSSSNIPSNNFSIVFSSDGIDGLWDIATISMRGIKSCQSWDGQYRSNLVGSIVDPFTGVIYLTSGTKFGEYGSKMIKRCIVRFVVRSDTKTPYILIDRMYPDQDNEILNKFIAFVKEKTSNQFEVLTYYNVISRGVIDKSYIPKTNNINNISITNLSFRDTKINYGRPKTLDSDFTLNSKLLSKENKFLQIINKEAFNAFDKLDHSISGRSKKQTIINDAGFKYLLNKYYKDLAHKIIDRVPLTGNECFTTDYYNKLLYYFLSNRKYIEAKQLGQFVRHINSYYQLSKFNKFSSKDLANTIQVMNEHISSAVKEELKKRLLKQVKSSKKNAP